MDRLSVRTLQTSFLCPSPPENINKTISTAVSTNTSFLAVLSAVTTLRILLVPLIAARPTLSREGEARVHVLTRRVCLEQDYSLEDVAHDLLLDLNDFYLITHLALVASSS